MNNKRDNPREMTCAEVGNVLHISPQRVQQIEQQAMRKMREYFGERELSDLLMSFPIHYNPNSARTENPDLDSMQIIPQAIHRYRNKKYKKQNGN